MKKSRIIMFACFILVWAGAVGAAVIVLSARKLEMKPPLQPINFSHRKHAGELELDCNTCHGFFEISPVAGAPPLETCMQCHESVAADRPQIVLLTKYWKEKRPVEWARVYSLPDGMYFTHKRHVKAGLDCSACHGDVAGMDRMRRVRRLNMGWCVGCHREMGAPTDCVTCHK